MLRSLRALIASKNVPPDFVPKPTSDVQRREFFGRFGISVAQGVTFATYLGSSGQ